MHNNYIFDQNLICFIEILIFEKKFMGKILWEKLLGKILFFEKNFNLGQKFNF